MLLSSLLVLSALAQTPAPERHPFDGVAQVLAHPRCANCHPAGDRPLQKDTREFHKQNVSRRMEQLGHACTTCHPTQVVPGANMPPAAPHWHMPSARVPMVFHERTPAQLCAQLKSPADNGQRTLAQLREHMAHDAIVLWGFSPGEGRSPPPLSHAEFVRQVDAWLAAGAPCPGDPAPTAAAAEPAAAQPAAVQPASLKAPASSTPSRPARRK